MSSEPVPRINLTPPPVFGAEWRDLLAEAPAVPPAEAFGLAAGDCVLVVGAHPDDETLGVGAALADLATVGVSVRVLSLTVGEAVLDRLGIGMRDLPDRRRAEFALATECLGAAGATVLDFPDSRLAEFEVDALHVVRAAIALHAPQQVLTLWRDDPHRDHQAAGRVAVRAAAEAGVPCAEFCVWAQHWSDPNQVAPGPDRLLRLDTSPMARAAKSRALAAYASQTEPLALTLEPVLHADVVTWEHEIIVRKATR